MRSSSGPQPLLLGPRADIARIYKNFDLFVLNSFGEGMSNTLLEAMASGLPALCTAVGGNAELIADRERGVLIKPRDNLALAAAIRDYMSSPEKSTIYGRNARRFVEQHFSLEQMTCRYVSLYESLSMMEA